jgi:hypothetical protein
MGEQQFAVAAQNQGLRSLSLMNRGLPQRVLQPDLLQKVLTSCTGLTQLVLTCGRVDDQGLRVLLTHGTSITELTLGSTILTTSKADWPCSWRKLSIYGTLQEFAYLPFSSVQQLVVRTGYQPPAVEVTLPHDTPAAQLPDLMHQASHNFASCPAWFTAPPPELLLCGDPQDLTSAQRVQMLQALAPVAGRHVSKLVLHVKVQLGGAEVEALANHLAGSLTSLHLDRATLHDSFWKPLAQHFPHLQELCLGSSLTANVASVAMYLGASSFSRLPGRHARIGCFSGPDAVHLRDCVTAWGLEVTHWE